MYTLAANVSQLVSRTRIQLAIHGAAAAALVPALIWLAPDSQWNRPGLLAVLLALAVIADFNEVPLKNGLRFDAGMPLALITLAILGPLPALLVDLTPIAVGGLIRREKIIRQGNLANVAAYGWETVAATCLLAAAGVTGLGLDALPWLLLDGLRHVLGQRPRRPGHLRASVRRARRSRSSRASTSMRCPPAC